MSHSTESLPPSSPPLVIVPTWAWIRSSWHYLFAFGLGSGLSPVAPGTMGSLAAIPLFWLSGLWLLPPAAQAVVLTLIFIYGCYAAQRCGQALGEADHKGIVIDEIWAMWILLCIFPTGFFSQALIFGIFRLFDITKPYPIKLLETKFDNGFGVMIDDGLAAVYAAILLQLLWTAKLLLVG